MRAFIVLVITVVFLGLFVCGFKRYPDPRNVDLAQQLGATFGFWSAVAWGVSVVGTPAWTNWFNFFAAALAVLALGYATPLGTFG